MIWWIINTVLYEKFHIFTQKNAIPRKRDLVQHGIANN